jgi:hypothetical protein
MVFFWQLHTAQCVAIWMPSHSASDKCLEPQTKNLGDCHPDTLRHDDVLTPGRYSNASHLHADILDVQEITFSDEYPDTLTTMTKMALIHHRGYQL